VCVCVCVCVCVEDCTRGAVAQRGGVCLAVDTCPLLLTIAAGDRL
jgi:hypothetical protein